MDEQGKEEVKNKPPITYVQAENVGQGENRALADQETVGESVEPSLKLLAGPHHRHFDTLGGVLKRLTEHQ